MSTEPSLCCRPRDWISSTSLYPSTSTPSTPSIKASTLPPRYFRQLNETKLDNKVHYTRPLGGKDSNIGKFSAGASWVKTTRAHEEAVFGMAEQGAFFDGDLDAFFADENLEIVRGEDYVETLLLTDLINTDEGRMDVLGAYAMSDWNISDRIKLNTGVRVEKPT